MISQDPYYKHCTHLSPDELFSAGYLESGSLEQSDYFLDFLTTPTHKLKTIQENQKNVVLLSTGSFSPLHDGHIQMMEKAKTYLLSIGYNVIGGYFSFSHEQYVKTKKNQCLSMVERYMEAQEKIRYTSWMIDPFEAFLTNKPINFSDCLVRLKKYLDKFVSENIEVVYVFGDDNYQFAHAFTGFGECVCVSRVNDIQNQDIKKLFNFSNIHYFSGNKNTLSSTQLRLLRDKNKSANIWGDNEDVLLVRNDIEVSSFCLNNADEISIMVKNIFQQYWKNIEYLEIEEQHNFLNEIKSQTNLPVLSIDCLMRGDENYPICRGFGVADSESRPNGWLIRPEVCGAIEGQAKALKDVLSKIKNQSYMIVDDDIATGKTMSFVKNSFPDFEHEMSALSSIRKKPQNVLDIVDMRDFVWGCEFGGLVCVLPNKKIARVPYLFPYVNNIIRASISSNFFIDFNLKLWELNINIFKESKIKLQDLPQAQQELFLLEGFSRNQEMHEILLKKHEVLVKCLKSF